MAKLNWTLEEVARASGGRLDGNPKDRIDRITIDSRVDVTNALFVAIRGERFDGHDFVSEVARRGATAALVNRPIECLSLGQIVVDDTIKALQSLGHARRAQFRGPVVAITGSSGKTTTRRLVHGILGEKYLTHQPQKNFNNHIGVPLTLLELEERHEACVLELGCSDFGEIETLTKISDPDVALITNVGPAHLEKLGDLDGVARAKGELFTFAREGATAVINLDDPRVAQMPLKPKKNLRFSTGDRGDVILRERSPMTEGGQKLVLKIGKDNLECRIPLIGIHNAANATAAIAVAIALGIEEDAITRGLANVHPEPGRLSPLPGPKASIIIDDTYNANPASMKAAIRATVELAAGRRTIAVIGDMLELGPSSNEHHWAIGEYALHEKVDQLVTLGTESEQISRAATSLGLPQDRCFHAPDHRAAAEVVATWIQPGDIVLIKGSRGMRMEQIVKQLKGDEG